jgi:hypothetical protein
VTTAASAQHGIWHAELCSRSAERRRSASRSTACTRTSGPARRLSTRQARGPRGGRGARRPVAGGASRRRPAHPHRAGEFARRRVLCRRPGALRDEP